MPDGWIETTLGEVAEVTIGGSTASTGDLGTGRRYPLVTPSEITANEGGVDRVQT